MHQFLYSMSAFLNYAINKIIKKALLHIFNLLHYPFLSCIPAKIQCSLMKNVVNVTIIYHFKILIISLFI